MSWICTILLGVGRADAHVPHDVVAAVAAPLDLDPTVAWFAIANPWTFSLLYRSTDGGLTWDSLGGDPIADELIGGVVLDDGTTVLASAEHLWVSLDQGATWARQDTPAPCTGIAGGDDLTLATTGGLWSGPLGALQQVTAVPVEALAHDGAAAIDARGGLWSRTEGAWTSRAGPPGLARAVAQDGDTLFVGADGGLVWRDDGSGWTACGAFPSTVDDEAGPTDVTLLAVDTTRGTLVAATAMRAPLSSADGCATWSDTAWTAGNPLYGVWGGTQSNGEAFTALYAHGETQLVAGWAGLALSADAGATWDDATLVPADSCRALAVSPTYPEDPRIYLGTYGAGPLRTTDFGLTWDADVHGLTDLAPQQIIPFLGEDGDTVIGLHLHSMWRSTDGGRDWERMTSAYTYVNTMGWIAGRDWLFAAGEGPVGRSTGAVALSRDGGETWEDVPGLNTQIGRSQVSGFSAIAVGDVSLVCVAYRGPSGVSCTDDEAVTWTARYAGLAASATAVVGWPGTGTERLVFADDAGVHASTDAGETWSTAAVPWGEPPQKLVRADDDSLLLATRTGRLLRSVDGGDDWEDLGVRLPAYPTTLAPLPDFASSGRAIVCSHDGPYLLDGASGATPTLGRWTGYSRIDDMSEFLTLEDCPEHTSRSDAALDSVQELPLGASARATLRGTAIRVWGESEGLGEVSVVVDGVERDVIGAERSEGAPVVLATVYGLGPGWHDIVLQGVFGEGVYLDAIEAFDAVAPPTDDTAGDPGGDARPSESGREGGCGCGGGGQPGAWPVGLLVVVAWIRRRGRSGAA